MSKCEAKKARCQGWMVRKAHNGPCAVELTKCQSERAQNRLQSSSTAMFVPRCNDDGSYATVQCHKAIGYCWCVTDDGKPIPGSSVREGNPTCDRQAGEDYPIADNVAPFRSSPTASLGSQCKQSKRDKFNANLKTIFEEEYARLPPGDHPASSASPDSPEKEKLIIEWKFTDLDANGDARLDARELRPLLRLMKKIVRPKTCAREFVNLCDRDADDALAEMEWSSCLGVDNIFIHHVFPAHERLAPDTTNNENEEPEVPTADSGSQDGRSTSPPLLVTRQILPGENTETAEIEESLSCETERRQALEEIERSPTSGIFVPQCTTTGDYRAAQCHEQAQYCWCVYVDTGRPIPGTSAKSSTKEDCSPLATSRGPLTPREFVGCPNHKKKRFLIKVVEKLYQEMAGLDTLSTETTTPALVELSNNVKEEAVIWKFGQLDRNSNVILESKEIEPFAADINAIKTSKKCRNNFLDYCDSNQDSRLLLREWLFCFDITPTTEAPPRRGRNPFIDRLTR
ncbi:SPARC-related modular calcium-binding protein 1-like isoform X1 [Diadema antillarum]|uniref:SPARC-related modular calcium-binding protein 1-like isoform X1 n=1 Tax=Diadema antillarum TaxID=105358 RepID=UPI003A898D6C